jgi:hypothetical protein
VDVRGRRSASGGCGNRIADLACGCVSRPGKRAQLPGPLAPEREGPPCADGCQREAFASNSGNTRSAQSAAQNEHSPHKAPPRGSQPHGTCRPHLADPPPCGSRSETIGLGMDAVTVVAVARG